MEVTSNNRPKLLGDRSHSSKESRHLPANLPLFVFLFPPTPLRPKNFKYKFLLFLPHSPAAPPSVMAQLSWDPLKPNQPPELKFQGADAEVEDLRSTYEEHLEASPLVSLCIMRPFQSLY